MGLVFVCLSVCHYFGQLLITQELLVRFDFPRYQKKHLDMTDPKLPITLGSAPPLVVKIDIKKII